MEGVFNGNRIFIFTTLFIVVTVLTAYMLYSVDDSCPEAKKEAIKYPGYFRTKQEQAEFAKKVAVQMADESEIPHDGLWQGAPVYHACCISNHQFVSPGTAENGQGEQRVIVQFGERRQYFLTQTCQHADGCTGCTCGQEHLLVTALVENVDYPDYSDQDVVLEFVRLPGCCKCFNAE